MKYTKKNSNGQIILGMEKRLFILFILLMLFMNLNESGFAQVNPMAVKNSTICYENVIALEHSTPKTA